jgi:hypothetical protein
MHQRDSEHDGSVHPECSQVSEDADRMNCWETRSRLAAVFVDVRIVIELCFIGTRFENFQPVIKRVVLLFGHTSHVGLQFRERIHILQRATLIVRQKLGLLRTLFLRHLMPAYRIDCKNE